MLIGLPSCADAQENAAEQTEAMTAGSLVSNVFAAARVEVGKEISLKQGVVSIEQEFKNGMIRNHARTRGFRVLFGNFEADQHGKGKVSTTQGSDSGGLFTDVEWEIISGYAMARGWRPRIRGTTATAAAEGTEMICQNEQTIASDGTVTKITRIYLISGSEVRVFAHDAPNVTKSITSVDHYIEAIQVGAGAITVEDEAPIPADPADPLRVFVNEVKAISLAAGL